jgi:hypothetical protein
MSWYVYFANFFAGAFFVIGLPHFIRGISGERFRTPFSKPKEGSSPIVNTLWGLVCFLIGYALLFGLGNFTLDFTLSARMLALGGVIMAIVLTVSNGRKPD